MSLRAVGWAKSFPIYRGPGSARRWSLEHLEALNWTEDAPDVVHSVLLTVSELVTNAHVHARSSAQLVLTWDGECLHVSVADSDPGLPAPGGASDEAVSGRGLAIVDALADRWDAHAFHGGKTITACFHPPGRPDPHRGTDPAGSGHLRPHGPG
ncbi:ATP-binding protein [Streptomyces sp. NPDC058613]|uniref:ATP-binding protein n=1 Tax=unclassified Streptomyces TaxID=2593676 RepID=UPI00364C4E53